jgi:hypothetical protein
MVASLQRAREAEIPVLRVPQIRTIGSTTVPTISAPNCDTQTQNLKAPKPPELGWLVVTPAPRSRPAGGLSSRQTTHRCARLRSSPRSQQQLRPLRTLLHGSGGRSRDLL